MGSIALHRFHQIGNKIQTALQLNINLRPSIVNAVAQLNEVVVQGNKDDGQNHHHNNDCNNCFHNLLLAFLAQPRPQTRCNDAGKPLVIFATLPRIPRCFYYKASTMAAPNGEKDVTRVHHSCLRASTEASHAAW